jgi:uncharacterized circularly permuted ATP-grasp superfamily protein/uncharacterized alpha-E superfamily protein
MILEQQQISSPPLATAYPGLCAGYTPVAGIHDEMMDEHGAIRPHWQMFLNLLDDLGPQRLHHRWETARQLIHDNGVTYNVYGDPAGMDRPWHLDSLPVLFSTAEWTTLEAGINQRARLLDAILDDLYGPQQLLAEGCIPPEIVFGHGLFLRPLHGVAVPGRRRLHAYAADIGRGSDGNFVALMDRTQAPSGTGYALENRMVVSRALPDVFRDCRVSRLATFFRSFRETLKSLSGRENPRIVVLTPGPYNETYFEHAYLARYLGYTLVEGADLIVRDNHVYLKMLGGLQRVDVILRRQDDDFCDPLELRADSALGVPGLVQAVYSGNVAVANALGSGLAETPALMMFLPAICRRIFGEDLKLPSVESFWCGNSAAREYVMARLPEMVIKPAFNSGRDKPVFARNLSQDDLEQLRARINASPSEYVGEHYVQLSTAPVLVDHQVQPRHLVLRLHATAVENSYSVMPGGLARFSGSADSMIVSMQRGGGSKDAWVLSTGPVDSFSFLQPADQGILISRAGDDLPSRVADNLFWLGRYEERAQANARLARGIVIRLMDQNFDATAELPALFTALTKQTMFTEPAGKQFSAETRLVEILLRNAHANGFPSTLKSIYRIAALVRDRMSMDIWRIINRLDEDFPGADKTDPALLDILPALDRLIITFAAFDGLAMESMTRGYAWRFLDIGRRIERAIGTLTLLSEALVPVVQREGPLLEAILEIADSIITYRRRYTTNLQIPPVLDLLLADEDNPRSAAFQLVRLQEHLEALAGNRHPVGLSAPERIALKMLTEIRLADVTALGCGPEAEKHNRREMLHDTLEKWIEELRLLSDVISRAYLVHISESRQLGFQPANPVAGHSDS